MYVRIRAARPPGAAGGDHRPRTEQSAEPDVRLAMRELPCRRHARGHRSACGSAAAPLSGPPMWALCSVLVGARREAIRRSRPAPAAGSWLRVEVRAPPQHPCHTRACLLSGPDGHPGDPRPARSHFMCLRYRPVLDMFVWAAVGAPPPTTAARPDWRTSDLRIPDHPASRRCTYLLRVSRRRGLGRRSCPGSGTTSRCGRCRDR
jgi:hypothetical protein